MTMTDPAKHLTTKQITAVSDNTQKKVGEWITWPQRARASNLAWWWGSLTVAVLGLFWLGWWGMHPGAPSCDGETMSPGDSCIFTNGGAKSYDEMAEPKTALAIACAVIAVLLVAWVTTVSLRARKPTPAEAASFSATATAYRATVVESVQGNPDDAVMAYHLELLDKMVTKALERNGIEIRGHQVSVV